MRSRLRIAIRRLVRRPTFTLAAVGTLAVGVGATTAIFSTVNATLLRPLPYARAQDIYTLNTRFVDGRWTSGRVTGGYVAGVDEGAPSVMRAVAVANGEAVVLADDGRNRQVLTQAVGEGFFDLMGVPMIAGRSFTPEDHGGGGGAIISDRLWEQIFGRDPAAVGRGLRMATRTVTVVGVAPSDFDVPQGTDVWFATTMSPAGVSHVYQAYLRVVPGTTQDRLEEELAAAMLGITERFPGAATGRAFVVRTLNDAIVGDLGTILLVVLSGAILLLILACVNVATLVLARGVTQTKELAVRSAHGATRSSIVSQFLMEAFLLSAAGTALGLLIAFGGVQALLAFGAADLPRLGEVPFDVTVLLFVAGTLALATVLVALLPAARLANPDIRGLLSESGWSSTGTSGTRRLLSGLVVVEIALGIALVSGAGWLTRSYLNLAETDPGFTPEGRLVFEALLSGSIYAPLPPIIETPDGLRIDPDWIPSGSPLTWLEGLTERLQATGQVTAVGTANTMPFGTDWDVGYYIAIPGEDFDPERQDVMQRRPVSPDFFEAMGIPMLMGRTFLPGEEVAVGVVNEEFVRRYLPGRDPLATSFAWGFPVVNFNSVVQIIGVVADVKYSALSAPADPLFYTLGYSARPNVAVATTLEDAMLFAPTIRAAAAEMDASIPIEVRSLEDVVSAQLVRHRLGLTLMIVFAVASLVLAAIGIYGLIAHSTTERSAELATRMALGATPRGVVRLVVLQGGPLSLIGIVVGLGAAYAGGRVVSSRLFGVRAADPLVLAIAAVAVFGITLLAYLVPAMRASRIQPAEALKTE